jgi:hypothetical protein
MLHFKFPVFLIYLPEARTSCLTHNVFPLSKHQPSSCFAAYLALFLGQSVLFTLLLQQLTWQLHHEITAILFEQQLTFLNQQ